jgi:hypothetical protein
MFDVLAISVPVFAVVALGAVLRWTGLLTDQAHAFVSRFVYVLCLPVLIFLGISASSFRELVSPAVVAGALLATALVTVSFWLASARLPARLRGPVALSPFFANLTYLGFPLATSAYGERGLMYAGIINAFVMPVFVVLGVWLLAAGHPERRSLRGTLRVALLNPIIGAIVAGVLASFVLNELGLADFARRHVVVSRLAEMLTSTLAMIGRMGLPLALIAVGASLRFRFVRGHVSLMSGCAAAKLVVMPLVTLLVCRALFPGMERVALGTTVLLMACPLSVGCYVISREMEADSEFIAGILVLTTVGACVTVPAWLAVVM